MFATEGAKIAITDINHEGAVKTADTVNERHPGSAIAFHHDVTCEKDWENVLQSSADALDGINVLVNNAGVASFGNVETEHLENYRRTIAIDTDSIFIGSKLAIPYLRDNAPASIVNISSVAGLIAFSELISYNVAKAAVIMMSKSIALHCTKQKYDVRCNTVCPAFTRTPIIDPIVELGGGGEEGEQRLVKQIPMRRLGEPEDVGYAVMYLASDESRFVTGSEIKVDGGITAG